MGRSGHTLLFTLCALASTAIPARAEPVTPPVRLLGEQIVPYGLSFAGTTVGGLSGIDYSHGTGEYVLISDDRSAKNPARFYTARIPVNDNGVEPVEFTGTQPLLTADGGTYPANGVDPEDLRVDPWTGDYVWTQEGERGDGVLADPSIRIAHPDGSFGGELPIPDNERMRPDSGPRRNSALEGATFAAGGMLLVSTVEEPLLQDGPTPTPTAGGLTRITVQARSGQLLGQYAYPLDPVFAEGDGSNGIAAVLASTPFDPARYLVLERAYVEGAGNRVRVYEADLTGATNILDAPLGQARPVTKRLLVDLADVGVPKVDNVEGMTWGPNLPSGERTLVLVSDNNFSDEQITQLVALAIR
ncbi:esterase-like activity of phytase family protein [Nocardia blacklockiae]|uniref:esterase-like activity of phytase family protein n=1 Tax=Nocardia blacklockiae TaxID=480036 RepID=UPI001895C0B6|nr:esterase-like activity of phytase family protein [Nocardia blacklockiae]MBF6170803.1 esterase-like activity of phytase family protein [Nocardia blacklockiae]